MYKACLLVVLVVCAWAAQAQLTFTSSWGGKRAALGAGSVTGTLNCRNDDAIAAIYRMIQNEAERFLLCQKP